MSDLATKSLGELIQVKKGKKPASIGTGKKKEADKPYLLIESFGGNYRSFTDDSSCPYASKEDTLLVWDGERCGLTSTGHEGYIGSTLASISRSTDRIEPTYLYHFLASKHKEIRNSAEGTGVPHVSRRFLEDIEIHLPPLPEQKKIAEILSGIDKVASSQQSKIRSSQVLRKALVSRYIENSEHSVEESKLGDLLLSIDSGWSPDCLKRQPANENEWSVLKTTSVTWKGFDQQERKALPGNLMPRPELVVEERDILITRAGPTERTGVVAYADRKAPNTMISDKIIRLRCDSRVIDPLFLAIFLGTDFSQRQMLKGKVGMALSQTNISQQLLKDMTIRFPPLQEQKRISMIVSELQKTINNTQGYVERIENLKQSVSADLLSGRKRVSI